jgi:hypothetical protein
MKGIVYVSTSVLAFAFVFALYYYLTIGKQSQQTTNMAHVSNQVVEQRCNCSDLSFLNGPLFSPPAVKPPLRAIDWPFVVGSPYTKWDAEKVYSGVPQPTTTSETIAINTDKNVGTN